MQGLGLGKVWVFGVGYRVGCFEFLGWIPIPLAAHGVTHILDATLEATEDTAPHAGTSATMQTTEVGFARNVQRSL